MNHDTNVQLAGMMLFFVGALFCGIGTAVAYEAKAPTTKWAGRALIGTGVFFISMPVIRVLAFFVTG